MHDTECHMQACKQTTNNIKHLGMAHFFDSTLLNAFASSTYFMIILLLLLFKNTKQSVLKLPLATDHTITIKGVRTLVAIKISFGRLLKVSNSLPS